MNIFLRHDLYLSQFFAININQIDLKIGRETKCDMAILLNLVSKFLDLDTQTLVLDRTDPNSKDFSVTHQSKNLSASRITFINHTDNFYAN